MMLIDDPVQHSRPGLLHILTTSEADSDKRPQTQHCGIFSSSYPSISIPANEVGALQTKQRQKRNTQRQEVQGAQQVRHETKSSTEETNLVDDALAEQVKQVQDISNSINQNDGPETSKQSFSPNSAAQQSMLSSNDLRYFANNINNNNNNNNVIIPTPPAASSSSLQPIFWLVFWDFENVNKPNYIPIWQFIRCVRSFISTVRHKDGVSCNPMVDSVSHITIIGNVFQMGDDMRAEFHASGVRLMHVQSSTRKDVADKAMLTDLCMIPVHHSPPLGVALLSGDVDFSYAMARLTALGYATLVIARHNSYSPLLASSSTYIASMSDVVASANSINLNGGDFATTVQGRLAQYRKQCRNRAGNSKNDEMTRPVEGGGIGIDPGTGKAQNEPETVLKQTSNEQGNQAGGRRARRGRARRGGTGRRGRGGHHQTFTTRESHCHVEPNEAADLSTETVSHNANVVDHNANVVDPPRSIGDVPVDIDANVKKPAQLTSQWNALQRVKKTVSEKSWRRFIYLMFAVFVVLLTVMLMLKRLHDRLMYVVVPTASDY